MRSVGSIARVLLILLTTAATAGATPAGLQARVPPDAAAYFRIPDPWGFLTRPKGSALNAPLAHPAHHRQVTELHRALTQAIRPPAAEPSTAAVLEILRHLAAPVEGIVWLGAADAGASPPTVLLHLNLTQLIPLVRSRASPADLRRLKAWGLLDARALCAGWGTSRGKGRLAVLLEAPRTGYRRLLPDVSGDLTVRACDAPTAVAALTLAPLDLLRSFEELLRREEGDAGAARWTATKEAFERETGVRPETALAAVGPEFAAWIDPAGEFAALRIRDRAAFDRILAALTIRHGLEHTTHAAAGARIHHLKIPSGRWLPLRQATGHLADTLGRDLVGRSCTHLYWIHDGDFAILAQVPQMLVDRQGRGAPVALDDRLAARQGQDARRALLLASATLEKVPRRLYYAYLDLLAWLADMAEYRLDLFALPSADELDLPEAGTYGLQLDVAGDLPGVERVFENNPVELLLSQDLSAAALLGVAAAVAIPNFIEYRRRIRGW